MSTTLCTKTIRTNVAKPSIESYNNVIPIKQKKKAQNLLNTNRRLIYESIFAVVVVHFTMKN